MKNSTIKLNTEQFILNSKKIHGDKYNYSLVNYVNNKTNVKLICKVHGEFEIRPDNHIGNKSGCHFCSNNIKYTTEQFVNKSIEVHGNKYDYSLAKYYNNKSKIKIICTKHGEFSQEAATHLNGANCPICSVNKKSTNEYIIISNNKHNNKYDYSLIDNNINNNKKVKIICPDHGIFIQSLSSHSKGSECPMCPTNKDKNTLEFINKSKEIHGNKYDYSLVNYINKRTKVKIICKIHAEFEQSQNMHINGAGCKKCADNSKKLNIYNFIDKCNNLHGNKYDYSLVNYINIYTKIKIICPNHGIFEQTPKNHSIGRGCPICNSSKGEIKIKCFLENNDINFISQYKIKDCRDKNELPFDFYLPDKNICIEYDGVQHYISVDAFGGDTNFKITQKHDNIKNEYCKNNNIKLIRIKYNDNIKEKLKLSII